MFLALGLEVADSPVNASAETPTRRERGTATYPVVSSVTAGGYASSWGVASGMVLTEVRGEGRREGERSKAFHTTVDVSFVR